MQRPEDSCRRKHANCIGWSFESCWFSRSPQRAESQLVVSFLFHITLNTFFKSTLAPVSLTYKNNTHFSLRNPTGPRMQFHSKVYFTSVKTPQGDSKDQIIANVGMISSSNLLSRHNHIQTDYILSPVIEISTAESNYLL